MRIQQKILGLEVAGAGEILPVQAHIQTGGQPCGGGSSAHRTASAGRNAATRSREAGSVREEEVGSQ
jgi:hypothetical protein